jgi:hypothetical protein
MLHRLEVHWLQKGVFVFTSFHPFYYLSKHPKKQDKK